MIIKVDQLQWHDAKIIGLSMESKKDSFDLITLNLQSFAFKEDFNRNEIAVQIRDCYKVKLNFNLWVVDRDTIVDTVLEKENPWIAEEKANFRNNFGPRELFYFQLWTVTDSKIEMLLTSENCLTVA
ncbi:hypothetical protein EHQ61_01120 [Leptospira wolffii]|uniref:hypothetical protein n=1 Tax=Leptospira wolffii TaxID=409998 RepID=UPI001083012C|nr:hypothetical protein [Leptospira wolffii]TGL54614.1 hypothetical protein EHQ61_01120 [Leptospira wolffii]